MKASNIFFPIYSCGVILGCSVALLSCATNGVPTHLQLGHMIAPGPLECPAGTREVVLPAQKIPVTDQDGLGTCTAHALAVQISQILDEPISPLCLALSRPAETKPLREGMLWFEGALDPCEQLDTLKKYGKVARKSDVPLEGMTGSAPGEFIKLLVEYRARIKAMSPQKRSEYRERLQALARSKGGAEKVSLTEYQDLLKQQLGKCSYPTGLSGLRMPDSRPIFEALLKLDENIKGDEEFLREVVGCNKNPIPFPTSLTCESVHRLVRENPPANQVWAAANVQIYEKAVPSSDNSPYGTRVFHNPLRTGPDFDFADRYIRESLDQEKVVGLYYCMNPLGSNQPVKTSAKGPECIKEVTDSSGKKVKLLAGNHASAIIGYRTNKNSGGKCEVEYLLRNSYGPSCNGLNQELRKKCNPETGDTWIPREYFEEIATRLSSFQ